ncbi:uncharacterized protein LOC113855410 [Abrus precatorius]|uniref:Uncharacterized protein LOC113855410 n=1 Tax=Abrus precatorius TaxID=3816 RepID=A0A8B8KHY4_ABRPR|nr:uncharacterized protein LOC113855410 [Abrus precatorius]
MKGVTPEEPIPEVVMQGGTDESILTVLRQLRVEMTEMKKERERDALELSALRRENANLREEIRTHIPSQTTPIIRDQEESSVLGLAIDKYDGTSDLGEHMDVFITQVGLYTENDALWCRIFPTSLRGPALSWFTRLSPLSIDSFATLTRRFNLQFATSQPHPLTSLALVNIRQEKGEPLRAFMERFGKATFLIHNLEPVVAIHHLTIALKPGPFVNSICKKPPVDLDELRSRVAKYMQMEELSEYRNQVQIDQGSNSKNTDRREAFKARQGNERRNELERPPRGPKYPSYTTLNTNRSRVLDQALAIEILRMPRRANTPPQEDKNFVQTNSMGQPNRGRDCYPEPPKRSDDKKFERHRSRSRELPTKRYDKRKKYPKRVINTIAGGFAGGGPTHSAKKRHLRHVRSVNNVSLGSKIRIPPITFIDNDFQGVDPVQDDPMVISVDILNCTVWKTLIDQGSSADILYWNMFKQLGISEEEIREYHELLVSFSGERVEPRGCILTCIPRLDQNMRKNAIVSTPHLAMKFPSERGRIVTVHADQKTARECYFASLRIRPFHGNSRDVNIVSPRLGEDLDVELDPRMDKGYWVEPNENKQPFQLGAKLEQVAYLGVANVVMVKKANGKWRMCKDFTDLNKACPKDAYPLPNIDTLVDGAAGHRIQSFLDAYSGYNQI